MVAPASFSKSAAVKVAGAAVAEAAAHGVTALLVALFAIWLGLALVAFAWWGLAGLGAFIALTGVALVLRVRHVARCHVRAKLFAHFAQHHRHEETPSS